MNRFRNSVLQTLCCVLLTLAPGHVFATDVSRADIGAWLAQPVLIDAPTAGSVFDANSIDQLTPWIAPGWLDEFQFPEVRVEIQETTDASPPPVYAAATERFKGQPTIGADGRLENYIAGQPFSDEQITNADPREGGFMVAWNQIHRWQYYGYRVEELTMTYLLPTGGQGPADSKAGLMGGGSVERTLHQKYHRVYLNKLSMLANDDYRVDVPDSDTRFFKDYIEFVEPFNIKGTKFVVERMLHPLEEDQVNTYLPTERRVRRVSAKERADSFMGSTSTLDDFEGFSGRVLDYEWTYLGRKSLLAITDTEQEIDVMVGPYSRFPDNRWQVRDCYVVELKSTWEGHPYGSRILFLDSQFKGVVLSMVFDREGKLWKTFQAMYRSPTYEGDVEQQLETSVTSWRGMVNRDRVAGVTTVVRAITPTEHPTMRKAAIKRIFSVSSLTTGQ